jgi:hypothetical protein
MRKNPMQLTLKEGLIIIVGNYGSGKTEVAVNLAFYAKRLGHRVTIADLDVVNPYFRCREQVEALEAEGIRVIAPKGAARWADVPAVQPEIKGAAQSDDDGVRIFDVGGDDAGATLLSSLKEALGKRPYELFQVVNAKRPFTDSVEGVLAVKTALERKSRLFVTGFIANTHLMEETSAEVILDGIALAKESARRSDTAFLFAAMMSKWRKEAESWNLDVPVLFMERRMLPPWKTEPSAAGLGFGPPKAAAFED